MTEIVFATLWLATGYCGARLLIAALRHGFPDDEPPRGAACLVWLLGPIGLPAMLMIACIEFGLPRWLSRVLRALLP